MLIIRLVVALDIVFKLKSHYSLLVQKDCKHNQLSNLKQNSRFWSLLPVRKRIAFFDNARCEKTSLVNQVKEKKKTVMQKWIQ